MFLEFSTFLVDVIECHVDDAVGGNVELGGESHDSGIVPAAVAEVGPLARGHVSLLLPRTHFLVHVFSDLGGFRSTLDFNFVNRK